MRVVARVVCEGCSQCVSSGLWLDQSVSRLVFGRVPSVVKSRTKESSLLAAKS